MQRTKPGGKVIIAVMNAIIRRKPKNISTKLIFDNVSHLREATSFVIVNFT